MKKRIKSIALSTLFLLPMLLSGCENPFKATNSVGSSGGYTETTPSNPNPSGGGSGGSYTEEEEPAESAPVYTTYSPYNYDEGQDPTGFKELSDSIAYVKSIYKKGTNAVTPIELAARTAAYKDTAANILTRLGNEYGIPTAGSALNPLSNVGAQTFRNYGLMASGYTPTDKEITDVIDAFLTAKYIKTFTIAGSMQYAMISTHAYGSSTPLTINYDSEAGKVNLSLANIKKETVELVETYTGLEKTFGGVITSVVGNTYALNESDGFYKITKTDGNVVYLIYKTAFVNNFGTNFLKLIDTHRDAIRYNVSSFTGTSSGSGSTEYTLKTNAWKMCSDSTGKLNFTPGADYVSSFVDKYKNSVAVDIASVMAFGVNEDKSLNVPMSDAGAAYSGTIDEYYKAAKAGSTSVDNYLAFVLKYVDHNGFVTFEADAIAEYLTNTIVGNGTNSVLAMDETRYTQNAFIDLKAIKEKSFNSNELMTNAGTNKARKLIANYANSKARAFEKNPVFKTITYETTVSDATDTTVVLSYTIDGQSKSDTRNDLFKNYYNTFYSACYGIGLGNTADISLLEINSNYGHLQNVTIVEEGEEEEEEESGEEDEEEENYILDKEYSGKLQSIVIFPKEGIDIRYMEVGVEAVLAEGQKLEITADLRYHVNGNVYYVPNAFVADGGGAGVVDSEEHIVNFEYQSGMEIGNGLMFKDKNNNLVKEKLLSFRNCVGKNTPDLRSKEFNINIFDPPLGWRPKGPGMIDSTAAFEYNPYASAMGANYIYNEIGSNKYDFIEVCFNVKTIYDNFDTNYLMNAKVTSVYGVKA